MFPLSVMGLSGYFGPMNIANNSHAKIRGMRGDLLAPII